MRMKDNLFCIRLSLRCSGRNAVDNSKTKVFLSRWVDRVWSNTAPYYGILSRTEKPMNLVLIDVFISGRYLCGSGSLGYIISASQDSHLRAELFYLRAPLRGWNPED